MLLHKNRKFTMGKLKSSLSSTHGKVSFLTYLPINTVPTFEITKNASKVTENQYFSKWC
jgi:hypothetical protein